MRNNITRLKTRRISISSSRPIFICEGIDQTRGWFYSLLAISAFISERPAYKNVMVNDLVLDKNGQKMSKTRGNAVEPWGLLEKYGADATRWYLLAVSPPLDANPLR